MISVACSTEHQHTRFDLGVRRDPAPALFRLPTPLLQSQPRVPALEPSRVGGGAGLSPAMLGSRSPTSAGTPPGDAEPADLCRQCGWP